MTFFGSLLKNFLFITFVIILPLYFRMGVSQYWIYLWVCSLMTAGFSSFQLFSTSPACKKPWPTSLSWGKSWEVNVAAFSRSFRLREAQFYIFSSAFQFSLEEKLLWIHKNMTPVSFSSRWAVATSFLSNSQFISVYLLPRECGRLSLMCWLTARSADKRLRSPCAVRAASPSVTVSLFCPSHIWLRGDYFVSIYSRLSSRRGLFFSSTSQDSVRNATSFLRRNCIRAEALSVL